MKKSLKAFALLAVLAGLTSCGTVKTSVAVSAVSSTASSVAASSVESSVASSADSSVASSESSAVESSVSSETSSEASSEVSSASTVTAHTVDFAKIVASKTDGFFTATGCTPEAADIKTGGTSVVGASANHIITFTAEGAGTLLINAKSGSTGVDRAAYLAKPADNALGFTVVAYVILPGTGDATDNTKAAKVEKTFTVPAAGDYYILSNDGVTVYNLVATLDSSKASVTDDNDLTIPQADASIFNPLEAVPGMIPAAGAAYGSFGIVNNAAAGAYIKFNSGRSIDSQTAKARANCAYIPLDAAFTYTLAADDALGKTVTIYASCHDAEATTATMTMYKGTDTTGINADNTTLAFASQATKTLVGIGFSITAAATYTFKPSANIDIYYVTVA